MESRTKRFTGPLDSVGYSRRPVQGAGELYVRHPYCIHEATNKIFRKIDIINDFKEIDNLSPDDFELFVRDVFVDAGWTDAVVTKAGAEYSHGDGGVDIFAKKGDKRFAIEVKQRTIGTTVDVIKSGMSIQDIDRYLFLHKKDEEVVRIIDDLEGALNHAES